VLAYVYWHRPRACVGRDSSYERALERFHRSFAHVRPSGFHRSTVSWLPHLPWEEPDADAGAYEDWHLVDGWSAIGVIEEAAVSRGHLGAHETIADLAGWLTASVYRLIEGQAQLGGGEGIWVGPADDEPAPKGSPSRGHAKRASPTIASLLGDGMEPSSDGLWRRCLGLGPAPEYCLQRRLPGPTAGVAPDRLPSGWRARPVPREVLFDR
jgi:hypothetical protein